MDIIIPTNYRPDRLNTTLSSLLIQNISGEKGLYLIDNGQDSILENKQIVKLIKVFKKSGWSVNYYRLSPSTISHIKHYALSLGSDEYVCLIDNDMIFTRNDTLSQLQDVLEQYDVAAVSPLAYEVDNERQVLNEYIYMYDLVKEDSYGVSEGNIALGICICLRRSEYLKIRHLMCVDFPYMEDQVLVHFLKKIKGYAFLKTHYVFHFSYADDITYVFNDKDVEKYFHEKSKKDKRYEDLYKLRLDRLDGAQFNKPVGTRK